VANAVPGLISIKLAMKGLNSLRARPLIVTLAIAIVIAPTAQTLIEHLEACVV